MAVFFHTIDVELALKHKSALKRWIIACIEAEKLKCGTINIIFCTDEHLLQLNKEHLQHDTYTDIITFDFTSAPYVSGDLYISFERVQYNAQIYSAPTLIELYRVIIHGVMHLCGYKDKTKTESTIMRQQEDKCLHKIAKYLNC